jgi:hypothetical protein
MIMDMAHGRAMKSLEKRTEHDRGVDVVDVQNFVIRLGEGSRKGLCPWIEVVSEEMTHQSRCGWVRAKVMDDDISIAFNSWPSRSARENLDGEAASTHLIAEISGKYLCPAASFWGIEVRHNADLHATAS